MDWRLVRQASRALRAGEVIAMPTDTVYGLAAAIDRPDAISRLFALKGRPAEKAIPVLLSDHSHVDKVASGLSATAQFLASSFWPGALTLVLPARPHLPLPLTSISASGLRTVAVRVPNHALACAIIEASGGALAVTSANRSGENPALEADEAASLHASPPFLVIDGGRVPGGIPSTVVLATEATPIVLREGAICASTIAAVLGNGNITDRGEASPGYDRPVVGQARGTDVADWRQ